MGSLYTVNRAVSVLVSMLRLAFERNTLLRVPIVHRAKEAAPRQGFFEDEQYEAVRRREAGVIRLDPGSTKNDDGRIVYMTPSRTQRRNQD